MLPIGYAAVFKFEMGRVPCAVKAQRIKLALVDLDAETGPSGMRI